MKKLILALPVLLCASSVEAQRTRPVTSPQTEVKTHMMTVGNTHMATVEVFRAQGKSFTVFATLGHFNRYRATLLGSGRLDAAGYGRLDYTFTGPLPTGLNAQVCVAHGKMGPLILTPPEILQLSAPPSSEMLDFDFAPGMFEPLKGEFMAEQFAPSGMHISALNAAPFHPDAAIIFDGANISGEDFDLATPGEHKLLIIAEDVEDLDADGYVDDPDDEAAGGMLAFDFDMPVQVFSLTMVDIDTYETAEARFYHVNGPTTVQPLASLGDNSIQTITFFEPDVLRMEVLMSGSAGILSAEISPCPYTIDMNEGAFGFPTAMQVGEEVLAQFEDIQVGIWALNANAGHPDMAVVLDTSAPGDDPDLITPGYGVGNTEPLGMVLIIAENDLDANLDGYVDDPDDEAAGGQIVFDFEKDVYFEGATVLDIDFGETAYFELFDGCGNWVGALPVPAMGDNSLQVMKASPPFGGVRKAVLNLSGSGAVTRVRFCVDRAIPDPTMAFQTLPKPGFPPDPPGGGHLRPAETPDLFTEKSVGISAYQTLPKPDFPPEPPGGGHLRPAETPDLFTEKSVGISAYQTLPKPGFPPDPPGGGHLRPAETPDLFTEKSVGISAYQTLPKPDFPPEPPGGGHLRPAETPDLFTEKSVGISAYQTLPKPDFPPEPPGGGHLRPAETPDLFTEKSVGISAYQTLPKPGFPPDPPGGGHLRPAETPDLFTEKSVGISAYQTLPNPDFPPEPPGGGHLRPAETPDLFTEKSVGISAYQTLPKPDFPPEPPGGGHLRPAETPDLFTEKSVGISAYQTLPNPDFPPEPPGGGHLRPAETPDLFTEKSVGISAYQTLPNPGPRGPKDSLRPAEAPDLFMEKSTGVCTFQTLPHKGPEDPDRKDSLRLAETPDVFTETSAGTP